MTWKWTRATCTTPEHERKRAPCHTLWCTSWLKVFLSLTSSPLSSMCISPWVHLSHLLLQSVLHRLLPLFPLMHFELHTELGNLIAMQNLRTSANKGSNDAYDGSVSLTYIFHCWWSMFWIMLILFPQTSSLRVKKLYCMCLRTTKQWSRWSSREGVPQWDMFPELTELRLIGCLIELIWIPKIQIKYIDTKNQLADILTKGNFTHDE